MDGKKIFLIVGALIVALGAAFGVNSLMRGSATPTSNAAAVVPTGPQVLVATRPLPVGTIITPDALRYQAWPQELVDGKNYFVKEHTADGSLVGTVVRNAITAGEPLTQGALVHPGDRGFLAAALGPGMRAITVSVSAESGVAGFVFPGDRVDLALTQTIAGDDGGPALYVTDTIVRNLRVLATDQRTTSKNADGKDEVLAFASVTLEVTPRIAEKITVAQVMGKLSLALRPLADDSAELERAIAAGEVSVPEDAAGEKRLLLEIKSRPVDTDITSTTGGEVSRYARRTKPTFGGGNNNNGNLGAPVAIAGPAASGPAPAPVYQGPSVRVSRAGEVSVVPVGGK
jgi:pilus assembly protein CpaB